MAGRWIKLHVKMVDSAVSADPILGHVWVQLLLRANWKRRQLKNGTWLNPGELIIGQQDFADSIGIGRQQLRRALDSLRRLGNSTSKPTRWGTHVTICNWRTYQIADEGTNQTSNQEPTRNQPGTNQEPTTEVEVLEQVEGKRGAPDLPPILDNDEFRTALAGWREYRGKAYKPRGLKALVTMAAKRAEAHGVSAVVAAFERAMANGWAGWDQDSSFSGNGQPNPNDPRNALGAIENYRYAKAQAAKRSAEGGSP